MSPIHRTIMALATALLLLPTPGAAQLRRHAEPAGWNDRPTWVEDVAVGAANGLLGGVTAALSAWLRDQPIGDAFLQGSVGGGVVFVGKRVAAEEFGCAGLLGRELAALGSSMTANAGRGRGWLEEVWLPVGPLWVQVAPAAGLRARVNMLDVGLLAWATARPELRFDWTASLSNGTPIFHSPGHHILFGDRAVRGFASGGVVALGARGDDDRTRAHEMAHVIQHDFVVHSWSRPIETRGWSFLTDRVVPLDLGVALLLGFVPPLRSLVEREAEVLDSR